MSVSIFVAKTAAALCLHPGNLETDLNLFCIGCIHDNILVNGMWVKVSYLSP